MKGYLIKWWKTAWREWEKPIGGDLNDENKLATWKAGGRSICFSLYVCSSLFSHASSAGPLFLLPHTLK